MTTDARLTLDRTSAAQTALEQSYEKARAFIAIASSGIPALEACSAMARLYQVQTCGKCVPCRIGTEQIIKKLDHICNGSCTRKDLDVLRKTATAIAYGADCALGIRVGQLVLFALDSFQEELESYQADNAVDITAAGVPCSIDCPAHVDIPGYIALVAEGRYTDAVRLIRRDNPFPTVCAFICEHPCENHCRRLSIDAPVGIRNLKRVAVDKAGEVPAPSALPKTGKRIGIVGGGPAGLTCAYYLQLMGHDVEVFERQPKLGGMLRYGIPEYRLPRNRLDAEIDSILSTGIKAHVNADITGQIPFSDLEKDFDAIFVSIGAHSDKKLGIENEDAPGVISAVDMLREMGLDNQPDFAGKKIVVVGGGNVAMDCVRTSLRLGASSVTCAYRRRKEDMTALYEEIEGAIAEGAEIKELTAPVGIRLENGRATGLVVKPQVIGKVRGGRPAPIASDEPEYVIDADYIVVAIGQSIQSEPFSEAGMPTWYDQLTSNDATIVETLQGVFVGGDCNSGPATVIKAIAAGKVAAANIDSYLGFNHQLEVDVDIPPARHRDIVAAGRALVPERSAQERRNDFAEFEFCLSDQAACLEAQRCLRCDCHGFNTLNKDWGAAW